MVFVVEDDLNSAQHAGFVNQGGDELDFPFFNEGPVASVELQLYLLADLESGGLVGEDVCREAAGSNIGDFEYGSEGFDAFALVLRDRDNLAIEGGDKELLVQLGAGKVVFQGVLALVHLGIFPLGLGDIVVEFLFPDLFSADGCTGLKELFDGLVVFFVGVHLRFGGHDSGNIPRSNLGNLHAEFVFGLYEVHQRIALADHVAFLDPDAVNLSGNGEPDFCLLDGLRDTVKTAGNRKRRPSRNEKCCFNVVNHGALVVKGGIEIVVFVIRVFVVTRVFFGPFGVAEGVFRHNQFGTEDEGVYVRSVVGVDGDVHTNGIPAVPVDEDVLQHLDKQRVLVDPGVGVRVVAIAIDGAVHSAGVVPLDAVGILGQLLGELDPHGILDAEGGLEFLVAGPGVACDRVNAPLGLESGIVRKLDFNAFARLFAVGDNLHGNQGCWGEGCVVV